MATVSQHVQFLTSCCKRGKLMVITGVASRLDQFTAAFDTGVRCPQYAGFYLFQTKKSRVYFNLNCCVIKIRYLRCHKKILSYDSPLRPEKPGCYYFTQSLFGACGKTKRNCNVMSSFPVSIMII